MHYFSSHIALNVQFPRALIDFPLSALQSQLQDELLLIAFEYIRGITQTL